MENLNNSSSNSTSISVVNKVGSGLLGFCFLLGLPGNIAVVVVILRQLKKDNFTQQLMLSLAFSDILFLITLPVWISYWIFDLLLGQALCKFLFFLVFTSMYSGVLTVTLMSVQRYLMVLHRNQWAKLGRRGERVLLFCLWILAFILANVSAIKSGTVKEGQMQKCWTINRFDQETLACLLCETLLGYFFPLCIIIRSYYCLHKKVNQTAFFSNKRLTRLLTTIVVTFVILWLPAHVINVVQILAIALKSTNPYVSGKLISFWNVSSNAVNSFTCLNCCMNPLLYACRFKQLFQNPGKPDSAVSRTQTSGV